MDPLVRNLFHELADVPRSDREKVFTERQIPLELRAEVESLFSFDSTGNHCFTEGVTNAAEDALQSGNHAEFTNWGPYRRIRLLGTGGMGSVYLAERTDGEIQQKVAVKLLRADSERPARLDRFLKERQLLAYLNHPSIARLIDAGHTADGRPYLVMEYVDGVPIDVYAERMDVRDQLTLFLRVCDGVSHAHGHLIIHRDLKPSNILVDAAGQPKLLDFGIAKLLDKAVDPTLTVDRMLTPNYASPEQLRGASETTASDVYSLGAVLYKILTGRSPHESESGTVQPMDVITGARDVPPPSRLNPNVPSDIDYILRKALRTEPEERYVSVEAFANDVRAFLDWRPVQARSGDAWYRARKFLRRYRVPVAAVLLLLMGLSLGLYEVNRERAVAQRRFQQVRQLANKVMALDNVIEPLLGSTKARQEIVAMSKEYLEGLGVEAHADPDLALEVGTAYTALARVQGVPNRQNLGEYAEAEESLIKAESFIDAVLTASPQNRSALLKSAEVNHDRMILADNAHRHEAVLDHARKAAARVDGVLALGSASSYEMGRAALIFGNIALVHKNQHLYEDSVRYARRSIEVAGTQPSLQPAVANALSVIADSLRYLGDLDGALKAIREARKAVERADFQNEPNRLSTTFSLLWREGMILGADGQISLEKPDEAIIVLQKAFDVIEDWVKKDADSASGRILFTQGGRELGNILVHHDPQRALAIFDHALLRLGEVKNNAKARRSEAQLLACSSYALRRLNRVNEAGQRIDTAFKLLRETKDYPAERINSDDETETVVRAWGAHLAETGQPQRAADVYQELLDKLMASHPDPNNDLRHATALSGTYEALAGLHLRNGQKDRAQTMSALRLEIWRNWDHKLPRVSFVHRQLEAASRP